MASALGVPQGPACHDRLRADVGLDDVLAALRGMSAERVLLVGGELELGRLLGVLTGEQVVFQRGSVARIDLGATTKARLVSLIQADRLVEEPRARQTR